jgi:hypothetical protein
MLLISFGKRRFKPPTLQRTGTNIKNWRQKFPEKNLFGHSLNFHIHVSVSDLYIPTIDLPILMQEICRPILEIYKSLTYKWDFHCSAAFEISSL